MTKGEHWTNEELEKQIEEGLKRRNRRLEYVKLSKDPSYRKSIETLQQSHLTDDEYKEYYKKEILPEITPPSLRPIPKGKFSFKEKTQIKKDWCKLFPEMNYSKKYMLIAKLVGPLFINITLTASERLNAQYRVSSGEHSFIYKFDYIIAGIRIDGHPHLFEPHEHEVEHINAANYLKKEVPILEGSLTLDKIFNFYKNHIRALNHTTASTPATLAAWAGDSKKAKQYLDWGYEVIADKYGKRPPQGEGYLEHYDILGRNLSLELPFKELWLRYHQDMLDNPEILRQIARNEVQRREWLKFAPYYEIEDVPYKEGNIFEKK